MTADRDDPETELGLTQAAPEVPLAWSADEDDDEPTLLYPEDHPDDEPAELWTDEDDRDYASTTVKMFIGLMVVVVLACVWLAVAWLHRSPDEPMPAAPASIAPAAAPIQSGPDDSVVPSTTEPPPVIAEPPPMSTEAPPPPPTVVPDADAQFLGSLTRAGIHVNDVPTAVRGGHATCSYIVEDGHTPRQAAEKVRQNSPTLSLAESEMYVWAAVESYCPQAGR